MPHVVSVDLALSVNLADAAELEVFVGHQHRWIQQIQQHG